MKRHKYIKKLRNQIRLLPSSQRYAAALEAADGILGALSPTGNERRNATAALVVRPNHFFHRNEPAAVRAYGPRRYERLEDCERRQYECLRGMERDAPDEEEEEEEEEEGEDGEGEDGEDGGSDVGDD